MKLQNYSLNYMGFTSRQDSETELVTTSHWSFAVLYVVKCSADDIYRRSVVTIGRGDNVTELN